MLSKYFSPRASPERRKNSISLGADFSREVSFGPSRYHTVPEAMPRQQPLEGACIQPLNSPLAGGSCFDGPPTPQQSSKRFCGALWCPSEARANSEFGDATANSSAMRDRGRKI